MNAGGHSTPTARIGRLVVPDVPRRVTQRGNRRAQTFFTAEDYAEYKALLGEWADHRGWPPRRLGRRYIVHEIAPSAAVGGRPSAPPAEARPRT